MDYRLENLSEDEFEKLVNVLCQKILGTGTVSFTKGRDGGRDGRFIGTANSYPSNVSPWKGKFIIQSKHTNDYQASCSDNTFYENKTSIIKLEIEKIKNLESKNEIDNYLLFTNRKETEMRENAVKYIKSETGLENVEIVGKDTIESWLSQNISIVKQFGLDKFTLPFDFYENDIKELIKIFHETTPIYKNVVLVVDRPAIEDKNKINNLDSSYFENILIDDLNKYHHKILDFLNDPKNEVYAGFYEETSVELKRVIELNIDKFENFKSVFGFMTSYILDKEPERLKKYRNIIPAFFHFMYYQCDIGREK
ncbi:ABC-three component system protein [Leptospira bandrabouensis]|uniref:ABC-three component systems C-terminal domain-containing protein n=1 Tax=Leptospira bandrabouensis TaxID=2484903 RepID=A0A6H3NSX1_9LEPT|nr:ABC-three component system protein [Leptospira bandrabouensis]TGN13453.1 hypothetical protein EHR08_11365 [Leptospira bandrabouensis]